MEMKNNILKDILAGHWISPIIDFRHIKFIVFLVVLSVIIVSNRYQVEKIIHEKEDIINELRNIKFDNTEIEEELVNFGRESKLLKDSFIISRGLKLPKSPHKRIIIEKM